jgi:hypothetical protein
VIVAFIITGYIGDKITFSEVAEVEGNGNKVCFKVRRADNVTVGNVTIFKRGQSENREFVGRDAVEVVNNEYICLNDFTSMDLTKGKFIVRFVLKQSGNRQNLRLFSTSMEFKDGIFVNIPLQHDEIVHYLGRRI